MRSHGERDDVCWGGVEYIKILFFAIYNTVSTFA